MQQLQPAKVPVKRLVVGLVLALISGLLGTILCPYVVFGPLLALLYAYGGFAPFIVCAVLQIAVYDVLGGVPVALLGLLASALPAAFAVRGVRWKRPFAVQLQTNLVAQFAGVLAALGFAFSQYGSLVPKVMELLRASLTSYPEELWNAFFQGRFGNLEELLAALEVSLTLQLPGMMLTMCVFSAVLMTALPNWLLRRRGETEAQCYLPLHEWRVPGNVVLGVLGMLVISIALYLGGLPGGDSVFMSVRAFCDVCFLIQAFGSIARLFQRAAIGKVWRNVCLILAATLLQSAAIYIGCFSALFGSEGVISRLIRAYREKHKDD